MSIHKDAADLADDLTELRRTIHREPEIGLELPRTQEKVLAAIDGLGLDIATGENLGSITAVLHGSAPGPTVLLRSDMDALPLQEGRRVGLHLAYRRRDARLRPQIYTRRS